MWNDFLKTEMHFFLSYIVITLIEIDNAYWFFFNVIYIIIILQFRIYTDVSSLQDNTQGWYW